MKLTIILLSGKAESGKDFCANIFKEQLERNGKKVLITHYADLLKYVCKNFFDWDGKKDEKGRHLLQYVGTDVVRNVDEDFWVDFVAKIISFFEDVWDFVIIPDVRYKNEIGLLKNLYEYKTISIRVNRPNYISSLTEEQQNHVSETALDDYDFDYYLNNTTKHDVEIEIENLVKSIIKGPTKIYVDMDCTFWDTISAITNLYNYDFHFYPEYKRIHSKDVKTWDFTELTLANKEYIDRCFNIPRFFNDIRPFYNAEDILDSLSEKYDIVFVSHGYKPNLVQKENYVKRYMPYAKFIGVDLEKYADKSCVDMTDGIFIDDSVQNLETSNAKIKVCYGDYEWNKDFVPNGKDCFRLKDWTDTDTLMKIFNMNLSYREG